MKPTNDHAPTWKAAMRIALVYALIGAIWILGSGRLLRFLVQDSNQIEILEYIKGWFYVLATAVLLGWWLNYYFRKIRKANDLLRKSETRFTTIFTHHLEAVGISRLSDGVFKDVNEAFARLYGYTREQIIGHTSDELFLWDPADRQKALQVLKEKQSLVFEIQAHRSTGETRDLLVSAQLIELDDEPCMLGTLVDITERKKAQNQIQQLNTELEELNASLELKVKERTVLLEEANKELESFSYSVSHDLRAPLRHINGFVGLLRQEYGDKLDEKARHYINTVSVASVQMSKLIDGLLEFSRNGRKRLSNMELDFNRLLQEVLEEMKPVISHRKIRWEIQELPKVYGDPTLLRMVWTNLLDNAVKYTRHQEEAAITVGCRSDDGSYEFCVRDNGVGFDMNNAQKLFGVFQRLHTQSEFEGTGIGLANVQRIIHKHSGQVWAESEPGKGAAFYFTLPKTKGGGKR